MQIDFANLQYQYQLYKAEIDEAIHSVLDKSNYIMGEEVQELEENLQRFTGAKHAITCSSGTDALLLALMALDIKPGDEVITTPFTFIATAESIAFLGAVPVFVDIEENTYNIDASKIEEKITAKTKAILSVNLYGQPADIDAIQAVIDKFQVSSFKSEVESKGEEASNFQLPTSNSNKIHLIIDGAQSFGSSYKGKTDSNLGDISTTSFFPAKPLGCFGDGGAVFTNDDTLAEKIKSLRVHGQSKRYHHQYIGMGGRMDTIQAAVLNVKLKYYEKDLALRQEVAEKYNKVLSQKYQVSSKESTTSNFQLETLNLELPTVLPDRTSVWAQYSIRIKTSNLKLETSDSARSELQSKLKEAGIPTAVHYPVPLHLQECFQYLGYSKGDFPIAEQVSSEIMSLPMNPYLSDEEIKYITAGL